MFIQFSYPISKSTTVMSPTLEFPSVKPRSRTSNGDAHNTSYINIFAHAGTHIDTPWHFNPAGKNVLEMPIEDFIFEKVLLLDIKKEGWENIELEELMAYQKEIESADAVLIRTGFSKYREEDPAHYLRANPALSEDAASFLAQQQSLRCIGVDFISIENLERSKPKNYPIHHILLDRENPILLLEDADLSVLPVAEIKRVYLIPLRMEGLEASPVTAVAEI